MRVGVIDIGSVSARLVIADGRYGEPPRYVVDRKWPTGLIDSLDTDGRLPGAAVKRLSVLVARMQAIARENGVDRLIAFATAVVRDAPNAVDVLRRIRSVTGVAVGVIDGAEDARLGFHAARAWRPSWHRPLLLLDIGGGSFEVAHGVRTPSLAVSLPLGARQLTRLRLSDLPVRPAQLRPIQAEVDALLAPVAAEVTPDCVPLAASKTFRQLARLAAHGRRPRGHPSAADDASVLRRADLIDWIPLLGRMRPKQRARLPGLSRPRARQALAGAIVAEAALRMFGIEQAEICPWGIREGILLSHFGAVPAAAQPVKPVNTEPADRLPR